MFGLRSAASRAGAIPASVRSFRLCSIDLGELLWSAHATDTLFLPWIVELYWPGRLLTRGF